MMSKPIISRSHIALLAGLDMFALGNGSAGASVSFLLAGIPFAPFIKPKEVGDNALTCISLGLSSVSDAEVGARDCYSCPAIHLPCSYRCTASSLTDEVTGMFPGEFAHAYFEIFSSLVLNENHIIQPMIMLFYSMEEVLTFTLFQPIYRTNRNTVGQKRTCPGRTATKRIAGSGRHVNIENHDCVWQKSWI